MEPRRPQLSLDELHQLRWLLGGGLVLLAVSAVFYLDLDAWTLMVLSIVGVGVVLARPAWPAHVPGWVHRLVFPAVVAFFLGDLWITGEMLPAIVRLDILLLGYRGTTYRKKRDDLQLIVLGLFLIVVAGVLTVSLIFAAQILVFAACALAFLLVITLVEAAEHGRPAATAAGAPSWTALKWSQLWARVRAVTDWRVVLLGAVLFAGVVGVSALLFLAIPRFQLENSLFLERFMTKKARTGFNDTIKFGDVTEILQDTSVALNVDVTDRTQIPASPYWRMLVLDEYRDGTFRLSPGLRLTFSRERTEATVIGAERPRRGEAAAWTFYLESGISRYLPLLGNFTQLRFQEKQNYRTLREQGVVALREEPVTMTAYRVVGMSVADTLPDATFGLRLASHPSPSPALKAALMLRLGIGSADEAAVETVLREITGGAALPVAEFTRRTNHWLGQHHGYALMPVIPAGRGDPLVRWLTSRESGHCELFAGSFALLARAAGFPTRVVTGFRGGSWNAYSGNFTLRNSDAHAWCEIFDRSIGAWRRADPTVGSAADSAAEEARGEATLGRRTDRSWSARFDSLRVFWYRRIVNFDQSSQVETLKAVKDATENSGRKIREWIEGLIKRTNTWLAGPWTVRRTAKILALAAILAGGAWGGRSVGRRWWRGRRGGRSAHRGDPVRAEAGRWLTRMAEGERRRPDGASGGREWDATVAELQRLRFGARAGWPEPERIFRQARAAVRALQRLRNERPRR